MQAESEGLALHNSLHHHIVSLDNEVRADQHFIDQYIIFIKYFFKQIIGF
jgi:hypothetical protein